MLKNLALIAALVLAAAGCRPAPDLSVSGPPSSAKREGALHVEDKGAPQITSQGISRDVVGKVVTVGEIHGAQPSTEWKFEADEYRRIDILERRSTPTGVDLLVLMLTRSNPKPDEDDVQVAGQLRLYYEWKGEKLMLEKIENVSFRYSIGVAT